MNALEQASQLQKSISDKFDIDVSMYSIEELESLSQRIAEFLKIGIDPANLESLYDDMLSTESLSEVSADNCYEYSDDDQDHDYFTDSDTDLNDY